MSKLRMKTVWCSNCVKEFEKLLDLDSEEQLCYCGSELEVLWVPESPMPLRASYYQGCNRFAEEKEWSKLNKERSQAGQEGDFKKQKEIAKEQKEVRKHRTKDERINIK